MLAVDVGRLLTRVYTMNTLKVGTKVLLEYKREYYERFFVGYNSKGLPVIEVDMNGTEGYMVVKENRLKPLD